MTPLPPALRARLDEIVKDAMPHDSTCPRSDNWQDPICDCGWLGATVRLTDDVLALFADPPQAPEASETILLDLQRLSEMAQQAWTEADAKAWYGEVIEVCNRAGQTILALILTSQPKPVEAPPPAPAAREDTAGVFGHTSEFDSPATTGTVTLRTSTITDDELEQAERDLTLGDA